MIGFGFMWDGLWGLYGVDVLWRMFVGVCGGVLWEVFLGVCEGVCGGVL